MKRIVMAMVALAMAAVVFAGCANSTENPDAGENASTAQTKSEPAAAPSITMSVNGASLHMTLADTEAASALVDLLREGPITVTLHSYGGFEKVGALPQSLPANDEQVETVPGDVMLYQGDQITVFFESNTWAYTPLGHIDGVTSESLLETFGDEDATVELSL